VLPRENVLRGTNRAAVNAKKTHCPHGHAYTSENTRVKSRGDRTIRRCRECDRQYAREYMARKRAAVRVAG
jgi:hypothetical protein